MLTTFDKPMQVIWCPECDRITGFRGLETEELNMYCEVHSTPIKIALVKEVSPDAPV